MNNDNSKYDVMSHLTDIPMLGKQYVPGLWRQIDPVSSYQPVNSANMHMEEPVTHRNVVPTTSVQQTGKENARTQTGGFYRVTDKRALPTPSDVVADSSFSAPPAKIPRFEKR